MFWIGFFSVYLISGCLFLFMKFANRLFFKFEKILKRMEKVACVFMFTVFSYMSVLVYAIVSLLTESIIVNAVICAASLVFCCWGVEKLYELMTGECKNKENKILTKEDKNVCNLCSLIAVIISCIILKCEERSSEYIILISISISIWIGKYIPLSEIYKEKTIKEIACDIKKEFKCKKSVCICSIASSCAILVIVSKNKFILRLDSIIDKMAYGIVCGTIIMIVAIMVASYFIKRKKNANNRYLHHKII